MQSKLESVSESGKIDAEAMQGYQDRFNELRAKEEELRAQGAMTSKAVKDLQTGLDELERDMDKDVKDKTQAAKSAPGSYAKSQDTSGSGSSYAQSGDTSGPGSSYAKSTDE
jgi:flavin-dependent dehydrogenase